MSLTIAIGQFIKLLIDLLFKSIFQANLYLLLLLKCQNLLEFAASFIKVYESLSFGPLVGQNKQFQGINVSCSLWIHCENDLQINQPWKYLLAATLAAYDTVPQIFLYPCPPERVCNEENCSPGLPGEELSLSSLHKPSQSLTSESGRAQCQPAPLHSMSKESDFRTEKTSYSRRTAHSKK